FLCSRCRLGLRLASHFLNEVWLSPEGWPASRLATLMSSSISGQWMPLPSAMSRHKRRSEGAACARRGNHASGADIVRASESSTDRVSAVTRTSVANASRLLAVKELIPALQQLLFVVLNQHSNPIEVFSPEPMTSFQSNWANQNFAWQSSRSTWTWG